MSTNTATNGAPTTYKTIRSLRGATAALIDGLEVRIASTRGRSLVYVEDPTFDRHYPYSDPANHVPFGVYMRHPAGTMTYYCTLSELERRLEEFAEVALFLDSRSSRPYNNIRRYPRRYVSSLNLEA